MKNLITVLVSVLFYLGLYAQAPDKMSYQSVIRNSGGNLVANTVIGIKISIVQGSESGTVVFAETHSTSTNANGLVSLQIGGGSPLAGTIGAVNWAAGPFFIKTETDPTGGSSYTISGASELLSVPYALYAANSTPGPKGDPGPIGNLDSINEFGDMLFWNGTQWTSFPIGKQGQVLTVCGGKPVWTTGGTCNSFYLGQPYQGGIIFYIDSTGQHGLIAAQQDQTSAVWGWEGSLVGTEKGLGKGAQNTQKIVDSFPSVETAASICANLVLNSYDDWYLPSYEEIYILKFREGLVGGFPVEEHHYWSSSEEDERYAWDQIIAYPLGLHQTPKSEIGAVRAIRSF